MSYADVILAKVKEASKNGRTEQLNLGQLIDCLERTIKKCEGNQSELEVCFDSDTYPTSLCSWRGAYEELAIVHGGYGSTSAIDFLKQLKEVEDTELIGWKGGEFIMDRSVPVWVTPEEGIASHVIVTGVSTIKESGRIIIHTTYSEY